MSNKISDLIESSFLQSENKNDFKNRVLKGLQELRENPETTIGLDVFYQALKNIWELGRASANFQAICNCASHRAFTDENVFFEDCPVHGINGTEPYGEFASRKAVEQSFAADAPMWRCRACGSENSHQFANCVHCGASGRR